MNQKNEKAKDKPAGDELNEGTMTVEEAREKLEADQANEDLAKANDQEGEAPTADEDTDQIEGLDAELVELPDDVEDARRVPEGTQGPDGTVRNAEGKTIWAPPGSHNAAMGGVQQDASGHVDSAGSINSHLSGTRR